MTDRVLGIDGGGKKTEAVVPAAWAVGCETGASFTARLRAELTNGRNAMVEAN